MTTASEPNPLSGTLVNHPLWALRLSEEVTTELFLTPPGAAKTTSFALLNNEGDFVREQTSRTEDSRVRTFSSWESVVRVAEQDGYDYVVKFKEQRVMFRFVFASGKASWFPAILCPHLDIVELINRLQFQYSPQEYGYRGL